MHETTANGYASGGLTIVVVTGLWHHVPWRHQSGHLWATLLGFGDLGAFVEMMLGFTFVFLGVGLLGRGWREVYIASRQGRLATRAEVGGE